MSFVLVRKYSWFRIIKICNVGLGFFRGEKFDVNFIFFFFGELLI